MLRPDFLQIICAKLPLVGTSDWHTLLSKLSSKLGRGLSASERKLLVDISRAYHDDIGKQGKVRAPRERMMAPGHVTNPRVRRK